MAVLDYLRRAGLAVELEGERLRVTPAERITADLRQFVRDHRAELLAELRAGINPPSPMRPDLRLVENTTPPSSAEAVSERQRIVRSAATASPAWLAARDQYLSHAMTCRACHAPTARYCPTGELLRAFYDATPLEPTP